MFKINLVPEVQEKKQKVAKINSTAITISVILVAIAVGVVVILSGIDVTLKVTISNTNNKISDTNAEIVTYAELEKTVVSLEKGLTQAKNILDGQNNWTILLGHIEAATPTDVKYTKLTIEPGKISATLAANNVDSLAKYVQSFKGYQLVTLSGTGTWGDAVGISIDSGAKQNVSVKSNGTWVASTPIDPNKDHQIDITNGNQVSKLTYTAKDKKVTTDGDAVGVQVKNLFTSVEVSSYTKAEKTTFDAVITYDGSMLW